MNRIRGLNSKMKFIGSKSDISVSTYIYSYIINLSEEKCKDYIDDLKAKSPNKDWRGKVPKLKQDFCYGFIYAVTEKLRQIKIENEKKNPYTVEVQNALMVVKNDNIAKYVAQQFKNLTQGKNNPVKYNRNHFDNGYVEGEKTGLYRGVGSKSQLQIGA